MPGLAGRFQEGQYLIEENNVLKWENSKTYVLRLCLAELISQLGL